MSFYLQKQLREEIVELCKIHGVNLYAFDKEYLTNWTKKKNHWYMYQKLILQILFQGTWENYFIQHYL